MLDDIELCELFYKEFLRVSYIYPILWRFGLIRVPEAIEKKMGKQR